MIFVIIDLEWNTAFSKEKNKYINELIEVGAVKLDDHFHKLDSYSRFVKPEIETHIHSRVRKLTNISNEDLADADDFDDVMKDFTRWAGRHDTCVMSWGDMDVRTLIDNYQYHNGSPKIPFIKKYLNMQTYFMRKMKCPKGQQISLSNAAEMIGIDLSQYPLHRALADSVLAADIFRNVYDRESFSKRVVLFNDDFYKKILFKPYVIQDINDPQVDRGVMNCMCPMCLIAAKPLSEFKFFSGAFKAFYQCPECKTKYKVSVQFKRTYDTVKIKKNISPVIQENKSAQ